jgi:hypothetical protein
MRIIGWILRIFGCAWALSGVMRIILAVMGEPGMNFAMGLGNLALAALAIWGSGKLLDKADKADKAKALKTID